MSSTTEVIDVTGKECCICLLGFRNGGDVTALTCGGHHLLHPKCCDDYQKSLTVGYREALAAEIVEDEDFEDEDLDVIAGLEADMTCPECRGVSCHWSIFNGQNYFKGKGDICSPIDLTVGS